MKKFFDNVQMLGTGEDCNSAKVVEKLLRHVITRRTSVRRGYIPEQGTHANKESLFASVTWLMRLPRRIQRMLLVMTIPASCREAHKRRFLFNLIRRSLEKFFKKNFRDDRFCFGFAKVLAIALVFTLVTTTESRAYESLPNSGSCGDGCLYEVTTDQTTGSRNLRIYNEPGYTGNNSAIQRSFFHAYTYGNDSIFQKIVIDGDFSSIGKFSFWNNVSKSGSCDVEIRGNIGKIELSAFDIDYLNSLTVLGSIGNFAYDALGSNVNKFQIYCGNKEICADLNSKLSNYKYYAPSTKNYKNLTGQISLISEDKCNQGDYYWNGLSCVREPDAIKRTCEYERTGYIKVGDYCASPEVTYAKKHYTPAEANQWLKDGNDNFVVLTFKK